MKSRERRDDDWIPSHKLLRGPIRRCADDLRMAVPIAPIAPRDPVTALFVLAFPEAALII
jgi:hypothetical protein